MYNVNQISKLDNNQNYNGSSFCCCEAAVTNYHLSRLAKPTARRPKDPLSLVVSDTPLNIENFEKVIGNKLRKPKEKTLKILETNSVRLYLTYWTLHMLLRIYTY